MLLPCVISSNCDVFSMYTSIFQNPPFHARITCYFNGSFVRKYQITYDSYLELFDLKSKGFISKRSRFSWLDNSNHGAKYKSEEKTGWPFESISTYKEQGSWLEKKSWEARTLKTWIKPAPIACLLTSRSHTITLLRSYFGSLKSEV